MKNFVINTLVVLGTLLGLVLLWQFRSAILLAIFSLILASTVRPAVNWFENRGLSKATAIPLVYLVSLGILGGLIYLVSGPLIQEIQDLSDQMATAYERIFVIWPQGTPIQQQIVNQLPGPANLYQAIAGERGVLLFKNVLGIAQGFFGIMAGLSLAVILSIYWAIDQMQFERIWLSWLPVEKRVRARAIWHEIETGTGAYLRSELIQSILVTVLLGVGYWLMGLPYPILLSLTGAIFWLIPWLGAVLTVLLPLVAGLYSGILLTGVACAYTIAVLIFLEFIVEPKIFDHRQYSSLSIVFFMLVLAQSYGLIGMVIAPPLAAASQILLRNLLYAQTSSSNGAPQKRLAGLHSKLVQIQAHLAETGTMRPEFANLIERLMSLVEQTYDYFLQQSGNAESEPLGLPFKK